MHLSIRLLFLSLLLPTWVILGADVANIRPSSGSLPVVVTTYSWSIKPVAHTAELVTLSCQPCGVSGDQAVPLLIVLRDTVADPSRENDRLFYLWLLSVGHFTLGQRVLSAVPFFYWRVGNASAPEKSGYPAPLLNLNAPLHPVMLQAGRTILQWAAFDPLSTSVRASSRSYQANQSDNERLQLEQAMAYLRHAPATLPAVGLTRQEIDTLMARLELRKSLLGGLLSDQRTARFGQQTRFEDERIRIRNLEALRQFAEKTGTRFEPLTLAGNTSQYGVLWFDPQISQPNTGVSGKPVWKILNIRDPWSDRELIHWQGFSAVRSFDAEGNLLPQGDEGSRQATLIPLAVYSLSYNQMPLLLVDFRDKSHVGRHEMLQRSITELTSGVLGLSHFANWYYYAGAFAYQTIWARRGTAANQAERLDSYAQFREQLALDQGLDPEFRKQLLDRAGFLNVNPLGSDPVRNMSNAQLQYARLARAADGGSLASKIDKERREELAAFGQSPQASLLQNALHFVTFGTYTHRVADDRRNLTNLDRERRLLNRLDYLEAATQNGTDPHVAFNSVQIDEAAMQIRELMEKLDSSSVRRRAEAVLSRLQALSHPGEELAKATQVADSTKISR